MRKAERPIQISFVIEVKFDIFLNAAMRLKADYVATGHYAQKETFINEEGKEVHKLIAGADPGKDQSYFLCQLSQEQLGKALFPIGHLQKSEVRKIAKEQDLITAERKTHRVFASLVR